MTKVLSSRQLRFALVPLWAPTSGWDPSANQSQLLRISTFKMYLIVAPQFITSAQATYLPSGEVDSATATLLHMSLRIAAPINFCGMLKPSRLLVEETSTNEASATT